MRLLTLIEAIEMLDEVASSPSALKKWSTSSDAEGMLMGVEFELYPPDHYGGGGYGDAEDTNVYDVDDIASYFSDTEGYNYVHRKLDEDYSDWRSEAIDNYVESNWDDSDLRSDIEDEFDINDYWDQARSELESEQDDDDEDEIDDSDIELRAEELMSAAIDEEIYDQGHIWQRAYDDYRDRLENDALDDTNERDWLEDIGVGTAYEAADYWGLAIPSGNEDENEPDLERITNSFSDVVAPDHVSYAEYHDCEREPGKWCVETDGSLIDPKDGYPNGVEIVSPPLPIDQMVERLTKVRQWAIEEGFYTKGGSGSTGLHMNISIPGYNREMLDYIKLVIFSDDKHILQRFGRESSRWAKSATNTMNERLNPELAEQVLEKMRSKLNADASRLIQQRSFDKYVSINVQNGRVEFRGPGGDYLSKDLEEIIDTMLRLSRALKIACTEDSHQKEYAKKLYRIMMPTEFSTQVNKRGETVSDKPLTKDVTSMFSKYAAGELDYDSFKNTLKKIQKDRGEEKILKAGGKLPFTVSLNAEPGVVNSFNFVVEANNKEEAFQIAKEMGSKYEPDPIFKNMWVHTNMHDCSILKGRAPENLARHLFKVTQSNGREEIQVFRNIVAAQKWISLIRKSDYNFPVELTDLESGESVTINGETPTQQRDVRGLVTSRRTDPSQKYFLVKTTSGTEMGVYANTEQVVMDYFTNIRGWHPDAFTVTQSQPIENRSEPRPFQVTDTSTGETRPINSTDADGARFLASQLWGVPIERVTAEEV